MDKFFLSSIITNVGKTGADLLHDARFNKGTAFTISERRALKLEGLLPPHVSTQDEQVTRAFNLFDTTCTTDLDKYSFLQTINNRNQKLFFRLMEDRLTEFMPIAYTPTVGQACQEFGHILRQTKGLYLSLDHHKGRLRKVLADWPGAADVKAIVVTDGERILGLGDLGTFGMGIPIGKLQLYTACGGVRPDYLLPICIDVGTNNPRLLQDPLYTGARHTRIRGTEYDEFIDEFVTSVQDIFGTNCLIQWEDFANHNANRLLLKYRNQCCTFNDDIQGTASVVLGGVLGSLRISKKKLSDHTFLVVGAGEAGIGIANLISSAIAEEQSISLEEAQRHVYLVDSKGLLTENRPSGGITEDKLPFAHPYHKHINNLHDTVLDLSPSVLIGVTAQPNIFTQELVQHISSQHELPLIFPLSNPTSKAECTAEDAYRWTGGNCVFASGSPFGVVQLHDRTYVPGQGNNSYIFPGLALAIVTTGCKRVTDDMMMIAAKTLASFLTEDDIRNGRVYPPLENIRDVSAQIAANVAAYIFDHNLATMEERPSDLLQYMKDQQYTSEYPIYA